MRQCIECPLYGYTNEMLLIAQTKFCHKSCFSSKFGTCIACERKLTTDSYSCIECSRGVHTECIRNFSEFKKLTKKTGYCSEHSTAANNPYTTPFYIKSMQPTSTESSSADVSGLSFRRIRKNIWLEKKRKFQSKFEDKDAGESQSSCGCVKGCKRTKCLNAYLSVECNAMNCSEQNCGNRNFTEAVTASATVKKFPGKGVGLVATEMISAGSFIIEYIGEIVSRDHFLERHQKKEGRHFYVMSYEGDLLVDATFKGNEARLINHSCDPNSFCEKWTVNGESRIGIFSNKTINIGEEITYNYKLESLSDEPFKCLCNSASCTGWIGGVNSDSKTTLRSENSLLSPNELILDFFNSSRKKAKAKNPNGTAKTDFEIKQEDIEIMMSSVDWFLSQSDKNTSIFRFFLLNMNSFKEKETVQKHQTFLVRNIKQVKHSIGRHCLKKYPKNEVLRMICEANFLIDEPCYVCSKATELAGVRCRKCKRIFHGSCSPSLMGPKNVCVYCAGTELCMADPLTKWSHKLGHLLALVDMF
jgi:SET domain